MSLRNPMMRSSLALLASFVHLFALQAVAHRDYWQINLPRCWQNCFGKTEDGCASSSCVCDTSQESTTYLSGVVSCAVSQCNADSVATTLVIGPLELICLGLNNPIPQDTLNAAYAAGSGTDEQPLQSARRPETTSSKKTEHTSSKGNNVGQELTATLSSTLTRTTTDSSGNTLEVFIPIVIGPSGVFTGTESTSTLTARASSTRFPSSVSVSPSPSAAASSPTPTQPLQPSTSGASSQRPNNPASGNGSPFENMQAGAKKWVVSGPLLCLGALTLALMRV